MIAPAIQERQKKDHVLQILITDDDEGDRKQIRRAISKSMPPAVCIEAASIVEAFAACDESEIDMVIMDYRMPGEDGLAGIAALRERFPLLPIIMSTGHGDEMVAIEAMKRGASDYVPKSKIDAESIQRIIENSLLWADRELELATSRTRLQYLGLNDSLTGLPNRTLFSDRLDQLILTCQRNSEAFALMMMDLNNFKEVNDSLGHAAGDAALCKVAQRLTCAVRKSDTVARLGGDEFACLISLAKNSGSGQLVAEKIVEALRQPMVIENHPVTLGISIGIAQFPLHGIDARTLMQRADHAMYTAKRGVTGIHTFVPGSELVESPSVLLIGGLMRAIANDELILHFQPQIDIVSRRIIGKEALVRWQHPEQGVIPPGKFIPAAEKSPAITALTHAVLQMALDQEQRWRALGFVVPVSVNLSARLLDDESLCNWIMKMLDEHGLPPECLILELTETALASSPSQTSSMLRKISDAGIRISIDDFGSGYTSFKQLRELEIAEIKIDGAYITNISEKGREASIVRSIVELGRGFNIHVIGECVEHEKSWQLLTNLGCNSAQGYSVGRPMPPADFDVWRKGWDRGNGPALGGGVA
jgi:diguanylate cyclase